MNANVNLVRTEENVSMKLTPTVVSVLTDTGAKTVRWQKVLLNTQLLPCIINNNFIESVIITTIILKEI